MADFAVPFVNQVSKQKDNQEQQQAMQQMMHMAQLMQYRQKQEELEEDRTFKNNAFVLQHPEFGEDIQLKAINAMAKQLKIPGEVTIDGLKPYAKLFTSMADDYAKNGPNTDFSKYGPTIALFQEKPGWLRQDQLAQLPGLADAATTQRATLVSNALNGEPDEVSQARSAKQGRAADLADLRGPNGENKARNYAIVNGLTVSSDDDPALASPEAKATAQSHLDRLQQLEDDDARDDMVINEDTHRQALNSQLVKDFKNRPDLLKKAEEGVLQKRMILPTDDNWVKSEINRLSLKSLKGSLSDDEAGRLDTLKTLQTGKSGASIRAAGEVARMTEQQQQNKSEGQIIGQVQQMHTDGEQAAEAHRTRFTALMEPLKEATLTEEQAKTSILEMANFSATLGQERLDAQAKEQPHIDMLTKNTKSLQQDVEDLRKQLPRTAPGQREEVRQKIALKEELLQARGAEIALSGTHHPLVGVDLTVQRDLHGQEAENIKRELGKAHTPEEKKKLEDEYKIVQGLSEKAGNDLDAWTKQRDGHLGTLAEVQDDLERKSKILDQKKNAVGLKIDNDDKTAALFQTLATNLANDMTQGEAIREAGTHTELKGANWKTAMEWMKTMGKLDYDGGVAYAQHIFTGLVAASGKKELNPSDIARYSNMAAKITQEDMKILVKEDDVQKAYEKGKTTMEIKVPDRTRADAIEIKGAWDSARVMINQVRTLVKDNPNWVGTPGILGSYAASFSQQWGAMWADVSKIPEGKSGSIDPDAKLAYKYFSSAPADKMEAIMQPLVYLVARAMSPVGVISDQDAEAARRMVGDTKMWTAGPEQVLNRLDVVEAFFQGKVSFADKTLMEPDEILKKPSPGAVRNGESTAKQGAKKTHDELADDYILKRFGGKY